MYDLPELKTATNTWWQAITRALQQEGVRDVPQTLARQQQQQYPVRETVWRDETLLLTQTCGYPLMHDFAGILKAVAAPVYNAEGCENEFYRSAIIVREDNPAQTIKTFRGQRLAANAPDSQSGCNCLRALVAPLAIEGRFFGNIIWTGAHRQSLAAVRNNNADIAAIDAVTLALITRHAPAEISGLRILCWSESTPALPYATRAAASHDLVRRLRNALQRAVEEPAAATSREDLLISNVKAIDNDAYLPIIRIRKKAQSLGYLELDK